MLMTSLYNSDHAKEAEELMCSGFVLVTGVRADCVACYPMRYVHIALLFNVVGFRAERQFSSQLIGLLYNKKCQKLKSITDFNVRLSRHNKPQPRRPNSS